MDPQFIIDRVEEIKTNNNERMDRLEKNLTAHLDICRENCISRMSYIETDVRLAHKRLNDHKSVIECLTAHKNKELGFRKAIYFGMTVMTIIIAVIAVWVSIIKP